MISGCGFDATNGVQGENHLFGRLASLNFLFAGLVCNWNAYTTALGIRHTHHVVSTSGATIPNTEGREYQEQSKFL